LTLLHHAVASVAVVAVAAPLFLLLSLAFFGQSTTSPGGHKFPLGEGGGSTDDILAFSLHVASSELCLADATATATATAATMSSHLFICI